MSSFFRTLAPALLGLVNLAAKSPEFSPLLSIADRTWPDKNHIGVVCNYGSSRDSIAELAQAARPGSVITVVDARSASAIGTAQWILSNRKVDFVVLLPNDRIFFEGGPATGMLVNRLAINGIPSVGTRPVGLKQGAVFTIGAETNGELLVTQRLVGTVSVILPNRTAKIEFPSGSFPSSYSTGNGVTVNMMKAAE